VCWNFFREIESRIGYILKVHKVKFNFHLLHSARSLIHVYSGCISMTVTLRMTVCNIYFSVNMLRLLICMKTLVLLANDWYSIYLSIVAL